MDATLGDSKNAVYLFEISDADAHKLNDLVRCQSLLNKIVSVAGLTQIKALSHAFQPQGLSIISLLAESHLAMHTWPETGTAYITLTTCKQPQQGFENNVNNLVQMAFSSSNVKIGRL